MQIVFVAQITQTILAALGLLLLVTLATYALVTIVLRLFHRRAKWDLAAVHGEFSSEHHLPDRIPVPREDVDRVVRGDFSFDEAIGWIEAFVHDRPFHRRRKEYQAVLKKAELYRELAGKMGRGLWRDVDRLSQRLSELDPLDPSAMVARGRAMRELGNFAGAIYQYQKALELSPFHSTAFPEMAATCRAIGQPGRFLPALQKAREELGDTHPLIIESRIQLGELVRVYADPKDAATLAHVPREQYLQNAQSRLDEIQLDPSGFLQIGQSMLADDMPELAESLARRCEGEYGDCAETRLLYGMVERFRFNYDAAEHQVREALARDDSAEAHLELGRVLLDRSRNSDTQSRSQLAAEAHQELRLSIDRDANLFEAIKLLVEPKWEQGIDAVAQAISPLLATYPDAWGPWRALGDAYATAGQYRKAIDSYRQGIAIAEVDQLLLPCMEAMQDADLTRELAQFALQIDDLQHRDPQVRWKVAQVLFENQKHRKARRVLQDLVDDERVAPALRQRAIEVLDHLDSLERKHNRRSQKHNEHPEQQ